jgi:hypothetical protein
MDDLQFANSGLSGRIKRVEIPPVGVEHVYQEETEPCGTSTVATFGGVSGNFNKLVDWRKTVASIGWAELHFHDLRHTGNTLAARTGTSLRDLMTRMGHDSMNAAIIYQHAAREADHVIADALDAGMRALREAATKATRGAGEGNRRGLESTR